MNIKELYEQVRDGKIKSDIDLQREIVYNTEKQVGVIDSLIIGIPLPAFYFWKREDGILEVLDGKQRIESIRRFIESEIQYDNKLWKQIDRETQDRINNTELTIITCDGEDSLKRDIFKRINTLGVPLSNYEVLNGLFHGEYLRGLSEYVKNDRHAVGVLGANGRGRNQYKILQLLMKEKNLPDDNETITEYVKDRQSVSFVDDQGEISKYIRFVKEIFETYTYLDISFNLALKYLKNIALWKEKKTEINGRIQRYLKSDDAKLTDKATEIEDIILAVVGNIKLDDKRLFSRDDKKKHLESLTPFIKLPDEKEIKYKCVDCKMDFYVDELTMDHVIPWSKGGRTEVSNAQLLCRVCNSKKGNRS